MHSSMFIIRHGYYRKTLCEIVGTRITVEGGAGEAKRGEAASGYLYCMPIRFTPKGTTCSYFVFSRYSASYVRASTCVATPRTELNAVIG